MATQHSEAVLSSARSEGARFLRQRPEYKRKHDLKKILLVSGLAALSWMSTYTGMLELVQANLGDLDLIFKVAIGASVAMLMLMVVWLLDQLFNESTSIPVRVLYVAGYLFLTLISVGFSFGFYWKFLESRSEASRGAESAVTQVQTALHGAETRLAQMQSVFDQLAAQSTQKAEEESTKGNSCPNSRPGDGPRRRLRDSDAASFSTASQFVQQRAASIKTDIAALDADLQKIVRQDRSTFDLKTGTRNEFIKALGRKLEMTVAGFNAFRTDPQLKQLRADFAERADKTVFSDDNGKTFPCPDAQIQASLHSAVKSIEALPQLDKPEIVTVEGADATIEAFRRLNVTLLNLVQFKLPATPDQIRSQQARAVQSLGADVKPVSETEAGLSQRDYIPLAIALFVDLCLLLVSIPRPVSSSERTRRRRAKSDGEIYRTLDDLYAIHDDPDARAKMEPLRHIAFDYMGHDYVAVPLIASREGAGGDRDGSARNLADDDMLEAQFIANFFSSQESGGPFKRASFPPVGTVRARLKRLGSKWAGIQSFRVYRFNKSAWSDFVLDMVVGADHELTPVREKQLEARLKKNEMKSNQIVFESELKGIEHEAIKSAKRKEAELNTLMIETNIGTQQQEADLRRREMSAQSELNTLGLEANIAAKRAEIERTRREISRSAQFDDGEAEPLKAGDGFELRADGAAARRPGFWDKILGGKDEAAPSEPTFERKARRARSPEPALPPSPDLAVLRDTVSELAVIMRELAAHQASQISLAARTAAAGKSPDPSTIVPGASAIRGAADAAPVATPSPVDHAGGRPDAEPFESLRPGHANWHERKTPAFDTAAGSARLEPEFYGQRMQGKADGPSSVIYMPGPAAAEPFSGHAFGAAGNAALDGSGSAGWGTERASPAVSARHRATGTVRFPEAFRWAAESTMAGGVHQIDHAIEPLVADAIEVGDMPEEAPELRQSWHPGEAPAPMLPPAGISTASDIETFITQARDGAEETPDDFAEGPQARWDRIEQPWLSPHGEAAGDDFDPAASYDDATREDIEVERIATKFGRGSSRRRRGN